MLICNSEKIRGAFDIVCMYIYIYICVTKPRWVKEYILIFDHQIFRNECTVWAKTRICFSFAIFCSDHCLINHTKPIHWTNIDFTLEWRHNDRDGVSNHQPHNCLLNGLFGPRSNKTSKLRLTGLCEGNSPGTGEFPSQRPVTWKMFPFEAVIMKTCSRFPDEKIHAIDSNQEALLLLRAIGSQRMKSLVLRDYRPHLYAEEVTMELTDEQVICITLFVRISKFRCSWVKLLLWDSHILDVKCGGMLQFWGSEFIKILNTTVFHWTNSMIAIILWWHHQIETFSALLVICAGNSPHKWPVMRSFDVFFDLRLSKLLRKQWWDWWVETSSCPLWRHCNADTWIAGLIVLLWWNNSQTMYDAFSRIVRVPWRWQVTCVASHCPSMGLSICRAGATSRCIRLTHLMTRIPSQAKHSANANRTWYVYHRADSRFAPSQKWETVLLCNSASHWLGASLESAQLSYQFFLCCVLYLKSTDWGILPNFAICPLNFIYYWGRSSTNLSDCDHHLCYPFHFRGLFPLKITILDTTIC